MMRKKKSEKIGEKGEREVQVRRAVIDWCFVFGVVQWFVSSNHWVPGGGTMFQAQTVP